MDEALGTAVEEWPVLDDFPDDMVVYRYVNDTLQSWCNQFTVDNDDISRRTYIQQFNDLRYNIISPLAEADTNVSYMNIGPKWYVVKAKEGDGSKVIGGLEIRNTLDGSIYNGVNRRLKLPTGFGIYPISSSGGSPVYVEGRPMMKVIQESQGMISPFTNLFSPNVYAAGHFFHSLGNVLLTGSGIFLAVFIAFLFRRKLLRVVFSRYPKRRSVVYAAAIIAMVLGILVYIHLTFTSIIVNSNISLELYKVDEISRFTIYVYAVYLLLLSTVPMLLQMLSPVMRKYFGWRYNTYTRMSRVLFAALSAIYIVATSSALGFKRETARVETLANRLALDRDLGFELQLRSSEQAILSDPTIASQLVSLNDYRVILNRITENYLPRLEQNYNINISISRDSSASNESMRFFENRLRNSVPIADGSHFLYSRSGNGRSQYTGVFLYYSPQVGITRLLLAIDSKVEAESRGYAAILGHRGPGSVDVPSLYSYAKYIDGKLVSYKGDYAYFTVLPDRFRNLGHDGTSSSVVMDKYMHFVNHVSEEESIVISRPTVGALQYLMAGFLIMVISYLGLSVPFGERYRKKLFETNYYKSRINTVLFLSLLFTLVVMMTISVYFVYKRNEANVSTLMTEKISTIQSLVEASARYFVSVDNFATKEMADVLEDVGNYTKSDITIYTTSGKVFTSTYPEIFERMIIGSRTDEEAFQNIIFRKKSFHIHKEKVASKQSYAMYAPIFNDNGKMLAIVGAPYTDTDLDLRSEALFHSIIIITMFFILLLVARFLTTNVVDKMFRPLINMGRKMTMAGTDGLEYIIYERDDEIASLVQTYNRMVHDLSESSKQTAQLERDKAWSEMARQVAHEIKNPLTPIKLQIQRIIRMKAKGSPGWEEKFDSIVPIIMDSIDTLTDTANEFSTFAKLYGEEPVEIDLDQLVRDQIALFDERDNLKITYFGLLDAEIMGPKPQLTRVFVNLLTNAIQAIENRQAEEAAEGLPVTKGQVFVSIRHSSNDGFYDILFEDNGPGVKDENRNRLFTPNFTTKSGGTGIGLAICKNILERCGAEISYSKSFALKGACFTIRYPKK